MGQIPYTTAEFIKIVQGREHSPIQDIVGNDYTDVSRLTVLADTEYDFICNGSIRNFKIFPEHVTNIWDTSTNKATFAELVNTPEIVANVQFNFDPSAASAGILTLKVYVNEDIPLLMKSYTIGYKAVDNRYTILATFYAGDAVGFDVKNKGVCFKIESTANGELYDPAIEIYRT